jgi:CRISPR system Cascade subunit CasC
MKKDPMKLIELHILQSFPVSCLNRDDVGAPKTAVFGGVTRARISSQCLKRAIREFAQDSYPSARFGGKRSRLIIEPLKKALLSEKIAADEAMKLALQVADELSGLDEKTIDRKTLMPKEGKTPRVGTLIFLSPAEIAALAKEAASLAAGKKKLDPKKLFAVCKSTPLSDAADIAVFGRMVAKGPDLTLEGAAMFGHALSTHKAENDIDFFAAVDDEKLKEEDAGAGHTSTLEFTSAVYYRYAALNLGLLKDHLSELDADERRAIVDAFVRATLLAVPTARHNSMNANVAVDYALGLYRESGHPLQLVNAFEEPVRSQAGLLQPSVRKALLHQRRLEEFLGQAPTTKLATGTYRPTPDPGDKAELNSDMVPPHVGLHEFATGLSSHVL